MAVILQGTFLFLGAFLAIINVRHSAGCLGRFKNNDELLRRRALEHRLVSMEREVKENSLMLEKFLESLERQFTLSKLVDLRELKRECVEGWSQHKLMSQMP